MSNSYAIIEEHSDVEWKFARTRLWMSYFEESATLPPPFNIFPTPKFLFKLLGLRKKDKLRRMSTKRRNREEKERDYRYTSVMRALVWRYVSAKHRQCEEDPVTEDDINEVKGDISAFRYELLDILEKNGMNVSSADRKEKTVLGKRMKIWERRLMKDFHVAPVAGDDEMEQLITESPPENEDSLAKFRRIAKLAVLNSSSHKWGQVVQGICASSQIGRCNNREAFRNQQYLQRAMEEARKLVLKSPARETSRSASPIEMPDTTGSTLKEILKEIKQDVENVGGSFGSSTNLLIQTGSSRPLTPTSIFSQIQKAPSRNISPQPPKSVEPLEVTISSKPKTPEKISSSPRTIRSPTPPSKYKSTENSITASKESETSPSEPSTPEDVTKTSNKPQTPDIEITDTDEEKSVLPAPALFIEPATPVKSRPSSPDQEIRAILKSRSTSPDQAILSADKTENVSEKSETELTIITTEIGESGVSNKIEETIIPETPTEKLIDLDTPPEPTVNIVDETQKTGESPVKITKRKAPIPVSIASDIVISRPVPSEKPSDHGMLPPPPSKSKQPAPQQMPELKLPVTAPVPEEIKLKTVKIPESTVSAPSESENIATEMSSNLIATPDTEELIPKDLKPPVPIRSVRKSEDIKPVRRQPKTGWL